MSLWHAIGRQLQNPSGLAGCFAGSLMRIVNDTPNILAVDALEIEPRDTVLELGFGPGHAIALMAQRASSGLVYGVDHSPVMLEQTTYRNRAAIRDGRVFLHQAVFDQLPFDDASFDKILAVNVVYFWKDTAAVLKEIRRVLRPNGRVSIYATDAATMLRWKVALSETHCFYGAAELAFALRQGGFDGRQIIVTRIPVAAGIQGLLATITKSTRYVDTTRMKLKVAAKGSISVERVTHGISSREALPR